MTSHYLQLSMDLDQWIGSSAAFYPANQSLERIWNDSRVITFHNTYVPFGIAALVRQLQTNSFFKNSMPVQKLDIASFAEPNGFKRVGELTQFVEENARPSPLVDAIHLGVFNWLEAEIDYAAGTALSAMWNHVNDGVTVPFATFGADRLATTFRNREEFFEHCGRARNLIPALFVGGPIRLVSEFHNHLLPCA